MKPWVRTDKTNQSSAGAALSARAFALCLGSAAPVGGSKNVCQYLTQGLRPGLGRSIALAGLFCDKSKINVSVRMCFSEYTYLNL